MSSDTQTRPPSTVDAQVDASAVAACDRSIVELLEQRPAWLAPAAGVVDEARLARVPVGPTLILGIGGSALGTRAVLAFARAAGLDPGPVRILDTVDPLVVREALDWATGCQATLQVVSKSGKTVEVSTLLEACLARGLRPSALISDGAAGDGAAEAAAGDGAAAADAELVASSPIAKRVREVGGGAHVELAIPAQVGGRWSIMTAVGQAPLRSAGLDPRMLTRAAIAERDRLASSAAERESLARSIAWRLAHPARYSILWCYSEVLVNWAAWIQQLECESLGRERSDGSRVGELVCVLRGPADQHSVAQLLLDGPRDGRLTFLDFEDASVEHGAAELRALAHLRVVERQATRASMTLPTRELLLRDPSPTTLSAAMLGSMVETAVAAKSLVVDPYGQPAVERIKQGIRERMRS